MRLESGLDVMDHVVSRLQEMGSETIGWFFWIVYPANDG